MSKADPSQYLVDEEHQPHFLVLPIQKANTTRSTFVEIVVDPSGWIPPGYRYTAVTEHLRQPTEMELLAWMTMVTE